MNSPEEHRDISGEPWNMPGGGRDVPGEPDAAGNPANFSASDLFPVLYCGTALFLVVQCGASLLRYALDCYGHFGYFDLVEDFSLLRLLAYSLLPFGFNLAFGVFFGLKHQSRLDRRTRTVNVFLLGFVGWWLLFNLPFILANFHFLRLGNFRESLSLMSWPPKSLYLSLRVELGMFLFMGNRALAAGFLGALGGRRIWRRLHDSKRGPSEHPNP